MGGGRKGKLKRGSERHKVCAPRLTTIHLLRRKKRPRNKPLARCILASGKKRLGESGKKGMLIIEGNLPEGEEGAMAREKQIS